LLVGALSLASGVPPALAQPAEAPDSLWEPYTPPPGDHAAAAGSTERDRTIALVISLAVVGGLGCALVFVQIARRPARRAAPVLAAVPDPAPEREPERTLWIPPARDLPVDVDEVPLPPQMGAEPPPRASRRHGELYDRVYQRELERLQREGERIRREVDRRNGRRS
jgi:hypothetical protein